jgi:hypothetical protein
MDKDPRSMLLVLSELATAGGWAASEVIRRYVTLSLAHAEQFSEQLLSIYREPDRPGSSASDRVVSAWALGYRDYVRELAASPALISMSLFERLDRARGKRID